MYDDIFDKEDFEYAWKCIKAWKNDINSNGESYLPVIVSMHTYWELDTVYGPLKIYA